MAGVRALGLAVSKYDLSSLGCSITQELQQPVSLRLGSQGGRARAVMKGLGDRSDAPGTGKKVP